MSNDDNDDIGGDEEGYTEYPVGYGVPPTGSRFKKGISGNPRGRPGKNRTRRYAFEQVALRLHEIQQEKNKNLKPALEIILLKLRAKAIEGNKVASDMCERIRGMTEFNQEDYIQPAVLITPEKLTQEEWEARYGR